MSQKIGNLIRRGYSKFEVWRQYSNSRNHAKRIRKEIVRKKGYSVLDNKLRKRIKEYAHNRFGSMGYSPWLESYTELSKEFIEG